MQTKSHSKESRSKDGRPVLATLKLMSKIILVLIKNGKKVRTAIQNTLNPDNAAAASDDQHKKYVLNIIDNDLKKFHEIWAPKMSKYRHSFASLQGMESLQAGSYVAAILPIIRYSKD